MDRKWKLIIVLSWIILIAVIGIQHMIFQTQLDYMRGYTEGYVQGYVPAYIRAKDERSQRGVVIPNPLIPQPSTQADK